MTTPNYPRTPARVQNDPHRHRETFARLQAELQEQTDRIRAEAAVMDRQHRTLQWFVLANDMTRSIRLAEEMGAQEVLKALLGVKTLVSRTYRAESVGDAAA